MNSIQALVTGFLVAICAIPALSQAYVPSSDGLGTTFRNQRLVLGTTEEEFMRRYPRGTKTSVSDDVVFTGVLPGVYINGVQRSLDPAQTSEIVFNLMDSPANQETGSFYFQSGRLVAMEINRYSVSTDTFEGVMFRALRSLGAGAQSCLVTGLAGSGTDGNLEQNVQTVRIVCGPHYLSMGRIMSTYNDKSNVGYSLAEGLADTAAKTIPMN
jgi:hypothetical protein